MMPTLMTAEEIFDAFRTGEDKWRKTKSQRLDAAVTDRKIHRFAFSRECLKD